MLCRFKSNLFNIMYFDLLFGNCDCHAPDDIIVVYYILIEHAKNQSNVHSIRLQEERG